jgi:hypothetical protein
MNRLLVATGCAAVASAAAIGAYVGLVTGRLTLDLGIGRRTRPLGPFDLDIAAPRETVYAAAAAPYADRQPVEVEGLDEPEVGEVLLVSNVVRIDGIGVPRRVS